MDGVPRSRRDAAFRVAVARTVRRKRWQITTRNNINGFRASLAEQRKVIQTVSRAGCRPERPLLLLTKYRLIVTSSSGEANIAGDSRCEGRSPILPKRAFTESTANLGIALIAGFDVRNAIRALSVQPQKLFSCEGSSL